MAAGEEKLEVLSESVVPAEVGEERTIGRGARVTFIAVTVKLEAKDKLVCELVLEERAGEGKVSIAILRNDRFTATPVDAPLVAEAYLEPERDAIPRRADAEPFRGVARWEFDEGEDTSFGKDSCFVEQLELCAEFSVAEALGL